MSKFRGRRRLCSNILYLSNKLFTGRDPNPLLQGPIQFCENGVYKITMKHPYKVAPLPIMARILSIAMRLDQYY